MGTKLRSQGISREKISALMEEMNAEDADWRAGKTWSLIYPAGDDVDAVLRDANSRYMFTNALNPFRFPSLMRMEQEVVSMTLGLLSCGEDAAGTMTSGGTESILMAVKTARNRARSERGIENPQLLIPESAHPAFAKAGEYLGVEVRRIPLDDSFRADVSAAKGLISDDTVLIVGSAPNYPHGVIDPIADLAALACERGISFHTDACVGGFLLPFLERLGYDVPPFDFRVEGVTTISADVHKYGYCTKGASVIAHRNQATLQYQIFLYDQWPGGLYGSPALAGARPGAPIAAAWAVMNYLGINGYERLTTQLMGAVEKLREGIERLPGLHIWGAPPASVLSFGSDSVDIMAVGDVMDDKGWHLDRQQSPPALHMMVTPGHAEVVDEFLDDLAYAVENHGKSKGKEARYS